MTTRTRPREAGPRLEDILIDAGCHDERGEGVCLMELVAWMAGQEHTAFPDRVMLALRDYASFANDHLDDGPRQMLREIARDLKGSGCECEQDVFDTLIREALRGGVCPGLRRNGMVIQAQDLEAALGPIQAQDGEAALDGFQEGPMPWWRRERVTQTARRNEMAARGLHKNDAVLEMTRQAHTAAASAWGRGDRPPALYEACWAAHEAVLRAIPDQEERAREVIRQIRAAMRACRCRKEKG